MVRMLEINYEITPNILKAVSSTFFLIYRRWIPSFLPGIPVHVGFSINALQQISLSEFSSRLSVSD